MANVKINSQKNKWDLLSSLVVPLLVVFFAIAFGFFELHREERRAEDRLAVEKLRADTQLKTEADRANQALLHSYMEDMTELLLDRNLADSAPDSLVPQIARSYTLAAVRQLDNKRNGILLRFLSEARLIEGSQTAVNLRGADLAGANLAKAYLYKANLSESNLSKANLSGANLANADLFNADLTGADLAGADLRVAGVSRANLKGADLSGANLSGANLQEADLRGANLSGANLSVANLSFTKLGKANLSGADLSDAKIKGADLSEAKGLTATQLCLAKTLFLTSGLLDLLLAEVQNTCPEKLLQ